MACHIVAVAFLVNAHERPPPRPPTVAQIVLRMVTAQPPLPQQLPPPPPAADPVAIHIDAVPPTVTVAADPGPVELWPVGSCPMLDAIGRALAADPRALAAIAAAPPDVRSEAGAIALWNGAWAATAATASAPLAPVREMVERTLAAAPKECLDVAETGPRLVTVGDAARPTLIVLGSGVWRWRDLAGFGQRGV